MNSATCRAWIELSAYHPAPAPASPTTGIVHQSVGTLRNHIENQHPPAPASPIPTDAGRARRALTRG